MDASPVNTGLSDSYNNLAAGLVDGLIGWAEAAIAYRLYEVAPYMVDVRMGAVMSPVSRAVRLVRPCPALAA